ncbi:MAG: Rossmann-like and DUF2520 domain-containing protein [Legionellales bacterium]
MKCNIIGAGRLGKNIALALSTAKVISVQAICNQSPISAANSCQEIGSGFAVDAFAQLPAAEIIWITCGDDAIKPAVQQLVKQVALNPGCLVFHCSGVLSSAILLPLKEQGCSIASIHPLKAFRAGYLDAHAFNDVDCVVEGDAPALAWLTSAFTRLGARIIPIKPEAKAAYHAAACMASNYLITLAACSEALLLKAGLTPQQARLMIYRLMQGNLTNLLQVEEVSASLTGPLMRGDIETLSLHLQAIDNTSVSTLYKAAGLATLPLTQLTEAKKHLVEKTLGAKQHVSRETIDDRY